MRIVSRTARWPSATRTIHHAPRLATALGLDPDRFWIKRDDLIGLGGGGNKIRKLQHTLAEAQQADADTLVTTASAASGPRRCSACTAAPSTTPERPSRRWSQEC
jgi:1-aminocyclopropane-1-carboxylate deaminase/D-cysteine desulfhydrase-like pyridoxal-dependent ACC family enzyme